MRFSYNFSNDLKLKMHPVGKMVTGRYARPPVRPMCTKLIKIQEGCVLFRPQKKTNIVGIMKQD